MRRHSCTGTSTAASVPCMFSHLGREGYDKRTANHESVLDVLARKIGMDPLALRLKNAAKVLAEFRAEIAKLEK